MELKNVSEAVFILALERNRLQPASRLLKRCAPRHADAGSTPEIANLTMCTHSVGMSVLPTGINSGVLGFDNKGSMIKGGGC